MVLSSFYVRKAAYANRVNADKQETSWQTYNVKNL